MTSGKCVLPRRDLLDDGTELKVLGVKPCLTDMDLALSVEIRWYGSGLSGKKRLTSLRAVPVTTAPVCLVVM
ncbi:MAG: hypothetical protein U1D69_01645 [Polynucleobacter sp.]|nr:hypothetical protein [Polynucleobacter sp.]